MKQCMKHILVLLHGNTIIRSMRQVLGHVWDANMQYFHRKPFNSRKN
jgi:hypothetical protein